MKTTRQTVINVHKIVFKTSLLVFQSRHLRKLIQQTFQQYASLKEDDCMIKFFETLKEFASYDEEVFPCELVVSSALKSFNLLLFHIIIANI